MYPMNGSQGDQLEFLIVLGIAWGLCGMLFLVVAYAAVIASAIAWIVGVTL